MDLLQAWRSIYQEAVQMTETVEGFRVTCTVSEMRRIKRYCAELRQDCERINAELERL